jgi:hypothetical protein
MISKPNSKQDQVWDRFENAATLSWARSAVNNDKHGDPSATINDRLTATLPETCRTLIAEMQQGQAQVDN